MNANRTENPGIVRSGLASESPLIAEKLHAFEQIANEVMVSFPFVQDVHGQRRFSTFPVEATVHYLHALWICDCKDMLLGVPISSGRRKKGSHERYQRYEGQHALELLCDWQEGESTDVIAFLELKLGYASFADITRSIEAAIRQGDRALVQRLTHGRRVLLSRTQNLERALAAIFALSADRLTEMVRTACTRYGHTTEQCTAQLAAMQTPLYAYVRHPTLARRNMLLMNALGVGITDNGYDRPGRRTAAVQRPTMPQHGYAEQVILGEMTM